MATFRHLFGITQVVVLLLFSPLLTRGFDIDRNDNLVMYWGQNSYGASHDDTANSQQRLYFYCGQDQVDVFPIAFLDTLFSTGGLPAMSLSNICSVNANGEFHDTALPDCSFLASDIESCQKRGHIVTLSIGGDIASSGFDSDSQAIGFADTLWDLFFEGSSSIRPFGLAVLDGIDLDVEGGSLGGWPAFIQRFRTLSNRGSKRYYVSAAPQCAYPDRNLGLVLNEVPFDMSSDNNPCGMDHWGQARNWTFGLWDYWARNLSLNKNVKLFIGGPASPNASQSGYVPPCDLGKIIQDTRCSFPSFGGVMLWDASQAFANERYDHSAKALLKNGGGTRFVYPACNAPAFVPGSTYVAGQRVAFDGYIWEAKWWAASTPASNATSEWSPVSACKSPRSCDLVVAKKFRPPKGRLGVAPPSRVFL